MLFVWRTPVDYTEMVGILIDIQKKQTILIVDDQEINRSMLADILQPAYHVLEATNGLEVISILQQDSTEISLLLLDIVMPEADGFEVLDYMNRSRCIDSIPVIIISSESSSAYIQKGYEMGVVDYINRPFEPNIVLQRIKNTLMLYSKQHDLQRMVAQQVLEKEKNNALMINILSAIVEFRNGESGLHVIRIRLLTEILLEALRRRYPEYILDESEMTNISNAAALHDIGKIAIPEEILNKPGRLTPDEFDIIKTHTVVGEGMLRDLPFGNDERVVVLGRQICRWHHERWDGRGYPDGLRGEEIPIAAQAVSLADVYDALVSQRAYKPAYSHQRAIEMIQNGECGAFNPRLMECLMAEQAHLEDILRIRTGTQAHLSNIHRLSGEVIERGVSPVSDRTLFLLEQERIKYQFMASLSNEILFEYDARTDLLVFSERAKTDLGMPLVLTNVRKLNPPLLQLLSETDVEALTALIFSATIEHPIVSGRFLVRCADGSRQWHEIFMRRMWENDPPLSYGVIGRLANVHAKTLENEKLKQLATTDALTGLLDSGSAKTRIAQLLADSSSPAALLLIDIDDFKRVNDNYGHSFGNRALQQVAQCIRSTLRRTDLAARVGGDEFLVYLREIIAPQDAQKKGRHLTEMLRSALDGVPYSVSIGCSCFPQHGQTYEDLFLHADQAMYWAKRNGKNRFCMYEPGLLPAFDRHSGTSEQTDMPQL